jgi:hypothetical protein
VIVQQQKTWGLVAILDALGASTYTEKEIDRFIKSRQIVLDLLNAKAEKVTGAIAGERLSTFTFNDTVVIVYRTERESTIEDVEAFFTLVRKFVIDSLVHRILFRGAIAIGSCYVNEETNTILGPAVTDAAAWYNRADWVGLHATPHASIRIQALVDSDKTKKLSHLILDYAIPLKDQTTLVLKAVNWPKAFFVAGVTPCAAGEDARSKCLSLLSKHQVPFGTERKYFNTIAFFDHAVAKRKRKALPNSR